MATILILDDRASNREFLVMLLGYAGHAMLEAADAEEALAILRAARPDLVITDILMPRIDGFDFVRRVRDDPTIRDTRVIFYSATYLESEARVLAQSFGVEHVLVKPAEPEVILATVEQALGPKAGIPASVPTAEEFDEVHQRVLLDKLTQKADELEALNAELEARVATRTAELAEANARLNELNVFRNNLLAVTSHDLRAPLGTIQHVANMVLEEPLNDEARRLVEYISSSAGQMIDLVNKLLDLSSLESGTMVLELAELRASDVARQALETLRFSAEAKGITTQLNVAPGEPTLYADSVKLSQIIANLVSNAIKFTPTGGQVSISVVPQGNDVRISVADTGLGIPQEELPFLFERLRKGHTYGTAGERGNGLGLSIVRQFIELHGGTVEVASEPGRGSIFDIFLPAGRERRV